MEIDKGRKPDGSTEVISKSLRNDLIQKKVPKSLTHLREQLEDRITQISLHYSIPEEDRRSLSAALLSELGLVWQDLNIHSVDTTLTQDQKVCLHHQTFSDVLHICEQLFLRHLHLIDTLRRRGIFSDRVNRCRVAAQLAMDCTRLLNVRSIRSKIITGISAAQKSKHTNSQSMKSAMRMPEKKAVEDDLKEIQDQIGELDLERVYDLLPCNLMPISTEAEKHRCIHKVVHTELKGSTASISAGSSPKQEQDQQIYKVKRCFSMPDLHRESMLGKPEITRLNRPSSLLVLLSSNLSCSVEKPCSPGEDLRRLLQESDDEDDSNSKIDASPLIESLPFYNSSRIRRLNQKLQTMLEKKEERKKQRVSVETSKAQGDNISVAVPPHTILHTVVPRVSCSFLPECIKLNVYPPIYNDLTKEIDSAEVNNMDHSLVEEKLDFSEIYHTLFKRIPTKYLNFDEDPRIEPALAKGTSLPKAVNDQKLINPSLIRSDYNREIIVSDAMKKRPEDVNSRKYRAWFQWWRCQISSEDYLDYISNQGTDYLSVLFHLYESDEDEEEAERQKSAEKRRLQQKKIELLKTKKQKFVPGHWNINTIEMGGLGGEPELDERSFEENAKDMNSDQVQERLERVWNTLHLTEGQRLDMAIKYSSYEYRTHLQEAIPAWEQAARMIQKREILLSRLEDFEREASDPKRFFLPGYPGSSGARMEEASQREKLNSCISAVDKELNKTMGEITARFNDNISYKGRLYKEKMCWDRTEMLYWLQQERRVESLQRFVDGHPVLPGRLPPMKQTYETHALKTHLSEQDQLTSHYEKNKVL